MADCTPQNSSLGPGGKNPAYKAVGRIKGILHEGGKEVTACFERNFITIKLETASKPRRKFGK
ncbi:hypothetical protein C943_04009 [Mariniradius saccharolyticus AK6]|uniref:Uncharacterized protein n=1 Tax=Mariniradius saccharolyticus AK6 TaxID=1239962 RepID=M7YAH6_9BACT|nr:hypothetical protein C943_04009 [Mariniradius saccharolyticus AK6]